MRRILHGRAGMAAAFLLGLLIATAGTATAARLITGKQIKDGSISSKDLSKALRAQLKKPGVPGAAGAPGASGAPGPKGDAGAVGPVTGDLPSGVTLRGIYTMKTYGPGTTAEEPISFGLRLASEPAVHVVTIGGPKPVECVGTLYMPEAAPGNLCVYRGEESGVSAPQVGRLGMKENPDVAISVVPASSRTGAFVFLALTGTTDHLATGSWAVTAP
jgi:hypothetical protein